MRKYKFNEKERQILHLFLNAQMVEEFGDRRPEDVIKNEYNGNEDEYLNVMMRWHNIKRSELRRIAKHWPG
jgi:hypothetical protein